MPEDERPQTSNRFSLRPSNLHNWAMDISALCSPMTGHEPNHTTALRLLSVAAAMEEQAALNQPDESWQWKTILNRSAGWLYIKASDAAPDLIDAAERCLTEARAAHRGPSRDLDELEQGIADARSPDHAPAVPAPRRDCYRCRVPTTWSAHPPRELTATELGHAEIVALLCSQCEWQLITEASAGFSGTEQAKLLGHTVPLIEAVLRSSGRATDADAWAGRQQGKTDPREQLALAVTARRHWGRTNSPVFPIRAAVRAGRLIPFGVAAPAPGWPNTGPS